MKYLLFVVPFALSACNSDGTPTAQTAGVISALCKADAVAQPVVVAVGSGVAVAINPSTAGAVAVARPLDEMAHAAIQGACPTGTAAVAVTTSSGAVVPVSK